VKDTKLGEDGSLRYTEHIGDLLDDMRISTTALTLVARPSSRGLR